MRNVLWSQAVLWRANFVTVNFVVISSFFPLFSYLKNLEKYNAAPHNRKIIIQFLFYMYNNIQYIYNFVLFCFYCCCLKQANILGWFLHAISIVRLIHSSAYFLIPRCIVILVENFNCMISFIIFFPFFLLFCSHYNSFFPIWFTMCGFPFGFSDCGNDCIDYGFPFRSFFTLSIFVVL